MPHLVNEILGPEQIPVSYVSLDSKNQSRTISGYFPEVHNILSEDTANPLSHHVIASSNCFSWTHALAPEDNSVKDTVKSLFAYVRVEERHLKIGENRQESQQIVNLYYREDKVV